MSDYWGVMPAAGRGERFTAHAPRADSELESGPKPIPKPIPKQYARAGGEFIIDMSLDALLRGGRLRAVIVSLAEDDRWWAQTRHSADPRVATCVGGATRAESVHRALERLRGRAAPRDWVVVHDAVRPCLGERELPSLMKACGDGDAGGVLVAPPTDTMKQLSSDGSSGGLEIERTLARDRLARALTPQMFRLDALDAAIGDAIARGAQIGDEAQAIELAGHAVVAVAGDPANVKLTYAHELPAVEAWLAAHPAAAAEAK